MRWPGSFRQLGRQILFRATDSRGSELWRLDVGDLAVPITWRNAVHLLGQSLAAQAIVFDPQGAYANALSFSPGLLLVMGR